MFRLIIFMIPVVLGSFDQQYESIVGTSYGKVGGIVKKSRLDRPYLTFSGIPFAKPPVGDLRFANPEKPEPWQGILDGTRSAPRCIQRNYLFSIVPPVEGKEDCLYLNVYVPQNLTNAKERLPVIVNIPWGGFIAGGGDEGYFDPSYFMDYDVILVSFNYRLGVFGFLSTLDDEAPGNYGFKDQVLALQWVQENIEHFGGLKEKVTIMGQSAGAGSVSLLMLSPAAKGLFSHAISQSGNALAMWMTPLNEIQKSTTLAQAELVNCSNATVDSKTLIKCLRNVSAEELALSQDRFNTFYQYPYAAFSVVTEKKSARNPNPILIRTPYEYITSGDFQKVPWLTGTIKNEGLLVVSGLLGPDSVRQDLNGSFSDVVPEILLLSVSTNKTEELFQNISELYLNNKQYVDATDEWEQGFINLFSDRYFIYTGYQTASLQVQNGHESIYFYNFEYIGEQTYTGLWANGSGLFNPKWTLSHCDDLLYQFRTPELFETQLTSDNDIAFSETFLSLWVNFATYGNPNPPENVVLEDIKWDPLKLNRKGSFVNEDVVLLNISGSHKTGATFNISQGFIPERMAFWSSID